MNWPSEISVLELVKFKGMRETPNAMANSMCNILGDCGDKEPLIKCFKRHALKDKNLKEAVHDTTGTVKRDKLVQLTMLLSSLKQNSDDILNQSCKNIDPFTEQVMEKVEKSVQILQSSLEIESLRVALYMIRMKYLPREKRTYANTLLSTSIFASKTATITASLKNSKPFDESSKMELFPAFIEQFFKSTTGLALLIDAVLPLLYALLNVLQSEEIGMPEEYIPLERHEDLIEALIFGDYKKFVEIALQIEYVDQKTYEYVQEEMRQMLTVHKYEFSEFVQQIIESFDVENDMNELIAYLEQTVESLLDFLNKRIDYGKEITIDRNDKNSLIRWKKAGYMKWRPGNVQSAKSKTDRTAANKNWTCNMFLKYYYNFDYTIHEDVQGVLQSTGYDVLQSFFKSISYKHEVINLIKPMVMNIEHVLLDSSSQPLKLTASTAQPSKLTDSSSQLLRLTDSSTRSPKSPRTQPQTPPAPVTKTPTQDTKPSMMGWKNKFIMSVILLIIAVIAVLASKMSQKYVIIEPIIDIDRQRQAADAWNEAIRNVETHQRVESDYQLYLAKQNDLTTKDASTKDASSFSVAVFVLLIATIGRNLKRKFTLPKAEEQKEEEDEALYLNDLFLRHRKIYRTSIRRR